MGTNSVEPIADRVGHVGGIESIVVDGRRWFFGIDPSLDWVVSPLIDDQATMSAFASRYMRQRDGAHDEAYWRKLVDDSIDYSELTSDDNARRFASEELAVCRLRPSRHLRYLLGAAAGWPDSFFSEPLVDRALTVLGVQRRGYDCIDAAVAAIDAADPAIAEAARDVVTRCLMLFLDQAPANWPEVFSALRSP